MFVKMSGYRLDEQNINKSVSSTVLCHCVQNGEMSKTLCVFLCRCFLCSFSRQYFSFAQLCHWKQVKDLLL